VGVGGIGGVPKSKTEQWLPAFFSHGAASLGSAFYVRFPIVTFGIIR
jgi:hypothetical protein